MNFVKVVKETNKTYKVVDSNGQEIGSLDKCPYSVKELWILAIADYKITFASLKEATEYVLTIFGATDLDRALHVLNIIFCAFPNMQATCRNRTAQIKIDGLTESLATEISQLAKAAIQNHINHRQTLQISDITFLHNFLVDFGSNIKL